MSLTRMRSAWWSTTPLLHTAASFPRTAGKSLTCRSKRCTRKSAPADRPAIAGRHVAGGDVGGQVLRAARVPAGIRRGEGETAQALLDRARAADRGISRAAR